MTGELLVLGAGEDQLPIYREARRRGIRTIAVDQRSDRPAVALADRFLQVSTRDPAAIAEALGPTRPAGVVSCSSDACLHSWHALARRYGAPYRFPLRAADASADKGAFHALAGGLGLPRYGWVQSGEPARVTAGAHRLRLPLVVKPADASGSKGTLLVSEPHRIAGAVAHAREHSHTGTVVAEEFVTGRHLSIETFLSGGTALFTAISEQRLTGHPRLLIGGHTCPAALDPATSDRLTDLTTRLSLAMGMTDGPVNFDLVLTPDGTPYVLEAGARLGGNGYPRMTQAVYGVDTVAALVSLALGEPVRLAPAPTAPRHGILHVIRSPLGVPGELVVPDGVDAVRGLPGVVDVELFARPGDQVLPFTQAAHKLGYLIVTGSSPEQAEDRLAGALGVLGLTVVQVTERSAAPEGELDAVN